MTASEDGRPTPAGASQQDALEANERRQFLKNISWTSLTVALRVISAGGALAVLSHLVDPKTMGLFGIGYAAVSFGFTISQSGAAQGIIALKTFDEKHLAAAQLLSMLISGVIACILVALSGLVEKFYHYPGLGQALVIGGLFVPLMSLGAVDVALAQKHLQFSLLAFVQTCAVFLAATTALVLGFTGHGLIALYSLQGLVGPYTFVMFRMFRKSAGFGLTSRRHISDIWQIGMHLSLGSLTGVIWMNVPQLVLAKVVTVEELGVFVFCSRVIQIIASQLSSMVNTVVYPTFARFQSQPAQLGRAFLDTVRFTFFCLAIPLIMLAAAPTAFLRLYGGAQWQAGGSILFFLIVMQMTLALGSNVFPTFQALGRPSVVWRWNLFITLVQSTSILVTARFGILAIVQGLAVTAWVMPIAILLLSRATGFRYADYWRNMMFMILSIPLAILAGAGTARVLPAMKPLWAFAGPSLIAASIYVGLVVATDKRIRLQIAAAMKSLRGKIQMRSARSDV